MAEWTLLAAAQAANLSRFLACERDTSGRWLLPLDLYLWATGEEPYPNIAAIQVPG